MENLFRFAQPDNLYALLVIPVLILLFVGHLIIKRKKLTKYGHIEVIRTLMPDASKSRPVLKFVIIQLALLLLIIALAQPQSGAKLQEVKRKGVELVIALDVSNSMLAEDIKPNRLERSKRAISKLIDRLHSDKIGIIVFAGDAYTLLPITTDYAAAKMFLSTINTDIVPKQGTAIGSAIEMGMSSFSPEGDKNKALIVITDGENHEDNAIDMAAQAREKGVVVHTIGMGLPKGAPIPVMGKYGQGDFRTDKQGNVVISKLDELMLQQIASAAEGIYIRANNTQAGLNSLFDEINKLEKTEIDAKVFSDYEDKFQYPVAVALILLLFEVLVLERKNKLIKNIKLFKTDFIKLGQ